VVDPLDGGVVLSQEQLLDGLLGVVVVVAVGAADRAQRYGPHHDLDDEEHQQDDGVVSQDAGFALEEGPDAPAGQSQAQDADPYGETADGEVGEALHSLVLVHLEDGAEGEQDRAAELQIGEYHCRKDEGGLTATTTFRVRKTRYFVTSETPIFDATGETCDEVPGDNCDLW
jgi:hypothetical protein